MPSPDPFAPGCFDAHSHLAPDVEPGAGWQVICGTCEADWEAVLRQAALSHGRGLGRILPMLGLHPWRVAAASRAWAERLEALVRSHRAGLGECGLDFAQKAADRTAQEAAFRIQLRLAHALRRPVAIHAVQAWGRLVDLLKEEGVPTAGALVHAFGGSPETARRLLDLGLCLSFSGDLLKPGRDRMRAALRAVPEDRLLLETDGAAPFPSVLAEAARIRGVEVEELAARTCENGRRCFKELMT